jgi:uncharacterized membrane protein
LALDLAIILAALGITTLELVEAAAVAIALYGDSRKHSVFGYVALGTIVVLVPALLLGQAISLLPLYLVQVVGGGLLLYFGVRLVRSARRTVLRDRKGPVDVTNASTSVRKEEIEKGIHYTAFSVGAIEAFEAAIVLVGLIPHSFSSTVIGLIGGVVVVILSTYLLRSQVRRIKQANMKVVVCALLLSFATFWFSETVYPRLSDLIIVPLFVAFALIVHWFANRPTIVKAETRSEKTPSKST